MQATPTQALKIEASASEGKACIQITDTGPGMPDSVRGHLFKAFTTGARKGGTGLGLTISRELARAQGGNLSLKETSKDGTVFVVGLPLA